MSRILSKKMLAACGLAVALVFAVGCQPADTKANTDNAARKVAVFKGGELTEGELQSQIDLFAQQSGLGEIKPGSPQYDLAVSQVMPVALQQAVVEAYARENGITVSDRDVQKAVDGEIDLIRQQIAQQSGGQNPDDAFKQALKQANLTEKQLRNNIERQLRDTGTVLAREVQERVVGNAKPSEGDVKKYYEQNKDAQFTRPETRCIRHILFSKDQKDKAEEVKQRLENGEDFAKLAKEFSQDPGSADKGGKLGCQPGVNPQTGQPSFVESFSKAAFNADEGEIVGPVETQFGYHLIEVTDIRKESVTPLDEVAPQIRQQLAQQRQTEEFDRWIQDQIKQRDVKYLPGYGPSASRPGSNDGGGEQQGR